MITEPHRQHTTKLERKHASFDVHGRLNPPSDAIVYSKESRRYFTLSQPRIDFSKIHANIQKHLPEKTLSVAKFEECSHGILDGLRSNEQTKNLLNGVHVPFFLPKSTHDMEYGQELEQHVRAVGQTFKEHFPQYTFTNYCEGALAGNVKVHSQSRHENLLRGRTHGTVVGWYFPNCLSEYGLPSQRAAMSGLSNQFLLSGGLDASAAFIGSPDLLLKKDDAYPHLLCLSAIEPADSNFFYHFEAYGWNLTFNRRSCRGPVSEYWAGGLTVIDIIT